MRKMILVGAVVALTLFGCKPYFTGKDIAKVIKQCEPHGGIAILYTGNNRVVCKDGVDINIKY